MFLHGIGSTANPPILGLDAVAPAGTVEKYKDSASINFSGGNPWKEVGTWSSVPGSTQGHLSGTSRATAWLGLKNSDDQGTQFDLRVELYRNGMLVAAGENRCIGNITRNATHAKPIAVSIPTLTPADFDGSSDVLAMRYLTRVGTNPDSTKCSGPGGSHNNAAGLRVYFDAVTRPAELELLGGQ